MKATEHTTQVLVIGAGIAGLVAAAEIQRAGWRVLVIDKGRGVGGRVASRRIGGATFDHGAQFITTRSPRCWSTDGRRELSRNGAVAFLALQTVTRAGAETLACPPSRSSWRSASRFT